MSLNCLNFRQFGVNEMLIHKVSPITNKLNAMEIDVTCSQIYDWEVEGMLIQQAMPNLTADEREFIKTGITPQEWDDMFGDED
tara:strand:- start:4388 stop:4636 length:249 start_codon:yes stop_codon:yes gene_type:complete